MSMVKDTNFVTIQGWMRTKLNLKGNELLIYALIYGFSQDDTSRFKGSRKYIAEWCGCSLDTVDRSLGSLVSKGLIAKYPHMDEHNQLLVDYAAILTVIHATTASRERTASTPTATAPARDPWGSTANADTTQFQAPADEPQPLIQEPQPTEHQDKPDDIKEIVDHLNTRLGTHYRPTTPATRKLLKARLKEGFTVEEIKLVIDKKAAEWLGNAAMEQYLRPETLFGNKFESYLNAKVTPQNNRYNTTPTYSPYCAPVTDDEEPSCSVGW